MADEEKKEQEAEEETPKKRSKLKLMIIGVVALGLAGGGGYFGYKKYFAKGQSGESASNGDRSGNLQANSLGPLHRMDTFIVNLAGDSGSRYLKVTMNFELNKEEVTKELISRQPQVRDVILTLLSSKGFGDVQSTSGKYALREEIVSRVNEVLAVGQIRRVFFTEFVVQ